MSSVWSSDTSCGCSLDDNYTERMQALAARWDLRVLQQELFEAMGENPQGQRVYVPSQLALALDMFLDSYGDRPNSERDG